MKIITAPVIFLSFSRPPVIDGALLLEDGTIKAAGPRRDILSSVSMNSVEKVEELEETAIMPGLVNCHCHLELSGAESVRQEIAFGRGFTSWVRSIMAVKERLISEEGARAQMLQMARRGILTVSDHGNTRLIPQLTARLFSSGAFLPRLVFMNEIIHPEAGVPEIDPPPGGEGPEGLHAFSLAAHSPYLCSPEAMVFLKQWCRRLNTPFSIHTAESRDEIMFLTERTGPLKALLEERGRLPLPYRLPRTTSVRLLDHLGLLDEGTICVHCVHVDGQEMELLASSGASVCLCPESNRLMDVGTAPADRLLKAGVNLCIGTDSLASNSRLDIFREMASLSASHPSIPPESILQAATSGGARALGMTGVLGEIGPGRRAWFLAVSPVPKRLDEVCEFLVKEACRPQSCSTAVHTPGGWLAPAAGKHRGVAQEEKA